MFTIKKLVAFMALFVFASAQLEKLPACSLQCFVNVLNFDGCGDILDFSCHCSKADLPGKITPCVEKACPLKDQFGRSIDHVLEHSVVVDQVQSVCVGAGHPITLPTPGATTAADVTTNVVKPTSTESATSVVTTSTSVLTSGVVTSFSESNSFSTSLSDAGETVTEPCTTSGTLTAGTPIIATPSGSANVSTPLVITKATPTVVTITQCYGTGTIKTCHPVESTVAPVAPTVVTETQCYGTGATKACHVSTIAITGSVTGTIGVVGTEPAVTHSASASSAPGSSTISPTFNGAGVLVQGNMVGIVAVFAAAAYFL
ncbi:proline-rich antigen [Penicillium taxi]|uniref:proline-rich antigen n=1 Tax=Penicillium taxi TaxID=168475 RepID=UPI0025453216|nr:proline-rich antigen [Penicillium taxi]KAJ5894788.1 proline-rich antigen [Penicillium taxi]